MDWTFPVLVHLEYDNHTLNGEHVPEVIILYGASLLTQCFATDLFPTYVHVCVMKVLNTRDFIA